MEIYHFQRRGVLRKRRKAQQNQGNKEKTSFHKNKILHFSHKISKKTGCFYKKNIFF